jgi:hypothetical protein
MTKEELLLYVKKLEDKIEDLEDEIDDLNGRDLEAGEYIE